LHQNEAGFLFDHVVEMPALTNVVIIAIGWRLRKLQPIGMLGRSVGNHDWLLANASACVSCGIVYATHALHGSVSAGRRIQHYGTRKVEKN